MTPTVTLSLEEFDRMRAMIDDLKSHVKEIGYALTDLHQVDIQAFLNQHLEFRNRRDEIRARHLMTTGGF